MPYMSLECFICHLVETTGNDHLFSYHGPLRHARMFHHASYELNSCKTSYLRVAPQTSSARLSFSESNTVQVAKYVHFHRRIQWLALSRNHGLIVCILVHLLRPSALRIEKLEHVFDIAELPQQQS
jgi:hypothetical protein